MADSNIGVDRSLAQDGIVADTGKPVDNGPMYRMLGDAKIPVAKKHGLLWKSRKDQGLAARGSSTERWDEAIKYYDNDQMNHRKTQTNGAGNTPYTQRLNGQWTETENVVFANASIMVPMLYAKNPTITVTSPNEMLDDWVECVQTLGNKLMAMKTAPGLSLKIKMRRTVLTALLTNSAFVKINWVQKADSSEQVLVDLRNLTTELQNAKTLKEIKDVEGRIMALEEKASLLSPSGPTMRCLLPHHIVVDPTASEPDGSDANWMMEWDYLPTPYINAVYSNGEGASIYEPTHILTGNGNNPEGVQEEVDNFKLIASEDDTKPEAYGFQNTAQLKAASMTKVWWVWDKVTRRVYLFADNNWQWPIWVWEDPLKLPRFFPYFRLWFHESVNTQAPKGEVTYYLDQQDAINEINDEVRRGRAWAKRNIFFNKSVISQDDVEAVLKGPDGTARGVKLEEGMKLDDAIMSLTPPALKFPELFNVESKFAAINRITGINDAMRGAQFKTNTTNQAIEQYNNNTDIRVDERVDLIEDFIADVMWNITMLCMMNWEVQDVTDLIGSMAEKWQRVTDNQTFNSQLSMRVEGGSSGKPNSKEMKQQAAQIGQIMGQFANAAPGVVPVMMKMFEKAFEGQVVISDSDWDQIIDTMMQSLQKAGGGPGEEQQGGAPQDPNAQTATSDEQLKQQVAQQIQALPPQAQQMLQQMVQSGMPPAQALQEVQKQVQQAKPN